MKRRAWTIVFSLGFASLLGWLVALGQASGDREVARPPSSEPAGGESSTALLLTPADAARRIELDSAKAIDEIGEGTGSRRAGPFSLTGSLASSAGSPVTVATVLLARPAERLGDRAEQVARCSVDGDGRFDLPVPRPGTYAITVLAEGFARITEQRYFHPPQSGVRDLGTIVLDPARELRGRAVDRLGRSLPGIRVALVGGGGILCETDEAGGFRIGALPASWSLVLQGEGFVRAIAGPEDAEDGFLLVPMSEAVQQRGRISGARSASGYAVRATAVGGTEVQAPCDPDGRFSLSGLTPHRPHTATVLRPKGPAWIAVASRDFVPPLPELVLAIPQDLDARARVVDDLDRPVEGVSFAALPESLAGAALEIASKRLDAESYALRLDGFLVGDGIGELVFLVSAPGHGSREHRATVSAEGPNGLGTIRLQRLRETPAEAPDDAAAGIPVTIHVEETDGFPCIGARVDLRSAQGKRIAAGTTGEDGLFRATVAPGVVEATVRLDRSKAFWSGVERFDARQEQTVGFRVPQEVRISGSVTLNGQALAGARLTMVPEALVGQGRAEDSQVQLRASSRGSFHDVAVLPGPYRAVVRHPWLDGECHEDVVVSPERTSVSLVLSLERCVVRVLDPAGDPVVGAPVLTSRRCVSLSSELRRAGGDPGSRLPRELRGLTDRDGEVAFYSRDPWRGRSSVFAAPPGFAVVEERLSGTLTELIVERAGSLELDLGRCSRPLGSQPVELALDHGASGQTIRTTLSRLEPMPVRMHRLRVGVWSFRLRTLMGERIDLQGTFEIDEGALTVLTP